MNEWMSELEAIDRSLESVAECVTQDEYVKGGSSAEALLEALKLMRSLLCEVTQRLSGRDDNWRPMA